MSINLPELTVYKFVAHWQQKCPLVNETNLDLNNNNNKSYYIISQF